MKFTHPDSKQNSFEGVGVFCDGKLHMGPFTCQGGDGERRSYSLMLDGRPANGQYRTLFCMDGATRNVDSKKEATDVSGC